MPLADRQKSGWSKGGIDWDAALHFQLKDQETLALTETRGL
jgi:hypothetical protein